MNSNWTQATTSPFKAIAGLLSCMESGKNCWIELLSNDDPRIEFPIQEHSEESKDPFNYEMLYASPSKITDEELKRLSPTEQDLTLNYTSAFGTKEAIEEYRKSGKLSEDLLKGMGINYPIKKEDFLKLRPDLDKSFNLWTTRWKMKKGFSYWTPVKNLKVFVVFYDDEPINKGMILKKASAFLNEISNTI